MTVNEGKTGVETGFAENNFSVGPPSKHNVGLALDTILKESSRVAYGENVCSECTS